MSGIGAPPAAGAPAPKAQTGYASFFSKSQGPAFVESAEAAKVEEDVEMMPENSGEATPSATVAGGAKKRPADTEPGDADSEPLVRVA